MLIKTPHLDTPFDEPLLNPIDALIHTPLPLNLPCAHKESIDAILDEWIVFSKDGGFHRFLVRWRGQPDSDCTWITQDELHQQVPDLLEYYQSSSDFHSTGSSSSHPRGVGADKRYKPSIIHINGRKSKKKTVQLVALWMEPVSN